MMNTIASIFKYSAMVLLILVLSHIIQIKGTTISQHVENGMNWVTGSRHASITRITREFSSANHRDSQNQTAEDSDGITPSEKNELNGVIRKSIQFRK